MIRSLLVANRGEIAVRIIRTCKEMGIRTVAVYSEADAHSLHVMMADRAVCVGPPQAAKSYLDLSNLITASVLTGCEAVHPGVGFLSENPSFARAVRAAGLIFIGPEAEALKLLGDKVKARAAAAKLAIPTTPGSEAAVSPETALAEAERIGFPVIIKAQAGGGGKGMRIVREKADLAGELALASHEAEASFSDGSVYLERYLEDPRHVELQVLGDGKGGVLVLGERDCSVQRRHQKLLEESPSPGVDARMRESMRANAIALFSGMKYAGAGTIEFLVKDGAYFFMEVNARVQVEHPITEMLTGVDIIKEQILACAGEGLSVRQEDIAPRGHALECRVNALAPGEVRKWRPPLGPFVRTDTYLFDGCSVPPYYDSLIAKIIVSAEDRDSCLRRMERALSETEISGVPTNIESQRRIIGSAQFRSGGFGTGIHDALFKEKNR